MAEKQNNKERLKDITDSILCVFRQCVIVLNDVQRVAVGRGYVLKALRMNFHSHREKSQDCSCIKATILSQIDYLSLISRSFPWRTDTMAVWPGITSLLMPY